MRNLKPRFGAALFLLLWLTTGAALAPAKRKEQPKPPAMNGQQRALHVLNRLAFGPRPGDLQRVLAMGVDKWIDLQLHPDRIDDSALETRLAPLRTLRMSTREMVEDFPPPQNDPRNSAR